MHGAKALCIFHLEQARCEYQVSEQCREPSSYLIIQKITKTKNLVVGLWPVWEYYLQPRNKQKCPSLPKKVIVW